MSATRENPAASSRRAWWATPSGPPCRGAKGCRGLNPPSGRALPVLTLSDARRSEWRSCKRQCRRRDRSPKTPPASSPAYGPLLRRIDVLLSAGLEEKRFEILRQELAGLRVHHVEPVVVDKHRLLLQPP